MLKISYAAAFVHFSLFLISIPIANLNEGWNAVFVWGIWTLIDLPVSLLHFFLPKSFLVMHLNYPALEYVLYPPYLIHGILGSIWWFYLPRIYYNFNRKKFKG
jgi:hypothetical protein